MTDQHVYDDEQAQRLANIYTAPATVDRRQRILELLDLAPGESVLSIGCGPGYEPAAIAEAVGEAGRVHAIDNSADIVAMATEHCADLAQVTIEQADAVDLPVPDESYDAALASLVYEYTPELERALGELYRVLPPGGRAAIVSTDWDSLVWYSSDADRMDRIIDAWSEIFANPRLGSQLTPAVRARGFTVEHVEPYSNLETDLETYAGLMLDLIKGEFESGGPIDESVVNAWEQDLRALDDADETFFNLTYYIYRIRKPT